MGGGRQGHPGNGRGAGGAERQILGNPPGTQPIHILGSVDVQVPLDPYMDLKALSQYSSISVRKLRDLLKEPLRPLPCYRVDGKILVRRSDFDRWMEAYRYTPDLTKLVDEVVAEFRRPA
ncbi:MAG: helix-turn-helix domain-containing protein [Candidatus Methylomirabilales bacterium]